MFDPFHVPTVKQICEEYGSLETKKEEKSSTFGEDIDEIINVAHNQVCTTCHSGKR